MCTTKIINVIVVSLVLASSASSGAFQFDLSLSGEIDAAVIYPSLNGYPYNAEFVDQAGSLRVGDFVEIDAGIMVENTGAIAISNLSGAIDGAIFDWTFGGDPSFPTDGTLRHDSPILLPGSFSEPVDSLELVWFDFREGPGGPTSLMAVMTLYAEPGTLVTPDRTLIPTSSTELVDAIDGVNLLINTPNSIFTAAFVTDPTYTITPAPGALAALGLAGLIAARPRRHTTKEPA